ncbi:MAG TPA: NADH-quinone oxidoreductase subunit J [Syntrophomonadaceae bacterium]|nr:NADH-quinone oxidoreductase subunit J [Syntrophomonadaceae bacterium]
MDISLADLAFIILAGFTLLTALGVVLFKNIVHSAIMLVFSFLGVAGIYFTMHAGFLGLVQILVYAGAISVLIIFAIMLVMNQDPEKTNLPSPNIPNIMAGTYLTILLVGALVGSIWFTSFPEKVAPVSGDELGLLTGLMLGDYVIPLELAALLLLVAVVGAIILARGAEHK